MANLHHPFSAAHAAPLEQPVLTTGLGLCEWRLPNGLLHCADGPAVTSIACAGHVGLSRDDNDETLVYLYKWYWLGELHRDDGPALIRSDGLRGWYRHGVLHRDDGAALEHSLANGQIQKRWFRDGKELSLTQFTQWQEERAQQEIASGAIVSHDALARYWYAPDGLTLHRTGGPAVELANGTKEWWQNGKRHRPGAPAIEYADGTREYYVHGKRHRADGPAVETSLGGREWWLHGKRLSRAQFDAALHASAQKAPPAQAFFKP